MAEQVKRRNLTFDSFDDVKSEVDRLHAGGYAQNGDWNLSQICLHLVEWMRYPIDGYPKAGLPMRIVFWCMKVTVGRSWKKKILASGFSPGMQTAPFTVFEPDAAEEAAAIEKLHSTIDRFVAHPGPWHASPLFSESDRQTLHKVQLLHCAHHLGFLDPK